MCGTSHGVGGCNVCKWRHSVYSRAILVSDERTCAKMRTTLAQGGKIPYKRPPSAATAAQATMKIQPPAAEESPAPLPRSPKRKAEDDPNPEATKRRARSPPARSPRGHPFGAVVPIPASTAGPSIPPRATIAPPEEPANAQPARASTRKFRIASTHICTTGGQPVGMTLHRAEDGAYPVYVTAEALNAITAYVNQPVRDADSDASGVPGGGTSYLVLYGPPGVGKQHLVAHVVVAGQNRPMIVIFRSYGDGAGAPHVGPVGMRGRCPEDVCGCGACVLATRIRESPPGTVVLVRDADDLLEVIISGVVTDGWGHAYYALLATIMCPMAHVRGTARHLILSQVRPPPPASILEGRRDLLAGSTYRSAWVRPFGFSVAASQMGGATRAGVAFMEHTIAQTYARRGDPTPATTGATAIAALLQFHTPRQIQHIIETAVQAEKNATRRTLLSIVESYAYAPNAIEADTPSKERDRQAQLQRLYFSPRVALVANCEPQLRVSLAARHNVIPYLAASVGWPNT